MSTVGERLRRAAERIKAERNGAVIDDGPPAEQIRMTAVCDWDETPVTYKAKTIRSSFYALCRCGRQFSGSGRGTRAADKAREIARKHRCKAKRAAAVLRRNDPESSSARSTRRGSQGASRQPLGAVRHPTFAAHRRRARMSKLLLAYRRTEEEVARARVVGSRWLYLDRAQHVVIGLILGLAIASLL